MQYISLNFDDILEKYTKEVNKRMTQRKQCFRDKYLVRKQESMQ